MKEKFLNVFIAIMVVIFMVEIAVIAMHFAGFEFSLEYGIYKATGWHATFGEIMNGVRHIDYQTHLNVFDIIRLWNV